MKPIERVELIIKQERLPVSVFEKKIGMSNNSIQMAIKRKAKLKDETLNSILKSFPRINPEWLLTGDGSMFRAERNPPDGTLDPEKKMAPNLASNVAPNLEKEDKKGTSGDSSGLAEENRHLKELLEEKEKMLGEKDRLVEEKERLVFVLNEMVNVQKEAIEAKNALLDEFERQLHDKGGGRLAVGNIA